MTDDDSLDILIVLKFFIAPLENMINDNGILHGIFGDITWMEDLAYSVYTLKASLTCIKPYPVKCYCTKSGAKIYKQMSGATSEYVQKINDELKNVNTAIQKTEKGLNNLPGVNILNAIFVAAEYASLKITLFNLKSKQQMLENAAKELDAGKAKIITKILCNPAETDKVAKAFREADIYNYLYTKYPNDSTLFLRLLKAFDNQDYILPDYTNYFLSAEFMSFISLTQQDISISDELLLFVPKDILQNIQKTLIKDMGKDKSKADPIKDVDTMMSNLSKMFNIPYTSGTANLQDQLQQVNNFEQVIETIEASGERLLEKRLLELGGLSK